MVVAECFLQISRLNCLVDELSSIKISLRLEDRDYELKDSYRIEGFKFWYEQATLDHLGVKNAIYQRKQKSELANDVIDRVQDGLRQLFYLQ